MAEVGHNSGAAGELRQLIQQWEALQAEKKDLAAQQKDIMSEAKARGYSTAAIRKIIQLRAMDKDKLAELEAQIAIYRDAVGI